MPFVKTWALVASLLAAAFSAGSHAQSYPTKPIRILTSGAGGGPDFLARTIATEFAPRLGQAMVVENRPSGIVLGQGVSTAAPDGHTLLVWGGALWLESLFVEVPYDPVRDFAPISTLTRAPNVLVVHPSLNINSVPELIKLAKTRPGQLNYSSSTNGSSTHIAWELFKSLTATDIVRVSYKGGPQELTDLLAGQIHMTFFGGATMAPHVKAGKLRALASASAQRSPLFPDLPAVAETIPGFVSESLLGFWAPGKTPDGIIKRLNQETVRLFDQPEVKQRILATGAEPVGGSPEQLANAIKSELARVGKVVKEANIKTGQ